MIIVRFIATSLLAKWTFLDAPECMEQDHLLCV
jgi:hypothetical protein